MAVWLTYAASAPFILARTPGVELSWRGLMTASFASAAAHAFVFMAIFLVLAAIVGVAAMSRRPGLIEYRLLVVTAAATLAALIYGLAFISIAFVGGAAAVAAVALGATLAAVWSGIARPGRGTARSFADACAALAGADRRQPARAGRSDAGTPSAARTAWRSPPAAR
jgi:hypothetical protein